MDKEVDPMAFRPMRRNKQALPLETCIEILKTEPRGVLSVLGEDGYPYGMPINQYYCPENGRLYFHTAREGHRLDAIRAHDKVSLCVYDQGYRKEGEWAWNISSVIVFGHIREVEDQSQGLAMLRELARKFTDDEGYIDHELTSAAPRVMILELIPDHITGKLVKEQ